jgi:hypothetical protein
MTVLIRKVFLFGALLAVALQVTSITPPSLHRRQGPVNPAASLAPDAIAAAGPVQPWNNPGQFHLDKNFPIKATPTTRNYEWTISQKTISPDGLERPMLLVNGKSRQ